MAAKKVVIVDDDESVRLFVRAIMEAEGWVCLEGKNGLEAVELCETELPDLVILDVSMPVMDGFEAYTRLRKGHTTSGIPIVFLTAMNDQESGLSYSADDLESAFDVPRPENFVDKPVDAVHLLRCIMGVVG